MTTPIVPSITDEDLESVRSAAEQSATGYACLHHTSYQAIIDRLRAAEKDAARYRWISENASIDWKLDYKNIEIVFPVDSDGFDYLDDLVDLAMEQQP